MSSPSPATHGSVALPGSPPAGPTFPPQHRAPSPRRQEWERLPPAVSVRVGVIRRLFLALRGMEGQRRWRLAFTSFVGGAQVIAYIVVLALEYRRPCDRPLGLYLILLTVRISLSFPTAVWSSIMPHPTRRDSDERREQLERNRLLGNREIDHNVRRISDLISLFSLVVFVLGNLWVIAADTCPTTAPVLYKTALAALILSWIWTLEFLLYVAFAIFFLPILLLGMRYFGWGAKKPEVGPLKKGDVEKLPRMIYVGTLPESDEPPTSIETGSEAAVKSGNLSSASTTTNPSKSTSRSRKRQWWRLWRRTKPSPTSSSSSPSSPSADKVDLTMFPPFPAKTEPIRLPESQNACSICLCEYEEPPSKSSPEASSWDPEILLRLPCSHAFHATCLPDWLAVSGRCPLCQQPVFPAKPTKKTLTASTTSTSAEEVSARPSRIDSSTLPGTDSSPQAADDATPLAAESSRLGDVGVSALSRPTNDQEERDRVEYSV
ncbi:hypothetical protein JCM10212_002815 [Sporobolomyces blumeae]